MIESGLGMEQKNSGNNNDKKMENDLDLEKQSGLLK